MKNVDQVYYTSANTNQHESTRVNTNQHESDMTRVDSCWIVLNYVDTRVLE